MLGGRYQSLETMQAISHCWGKACATLTLVNTGWYIYSCANTHKEHQRIQLAAKKRRMVARLMLRHCEKNLITTRGLTPTPLNNHRKSMCKQEQRTV